MPHQQDNKYHLSLKDLHFDKEIIEDGETFLDNAIIKAKTVAKTYNKPAM